MNKNTPFKLYANCKVVDGASISIICDLQKSTFVYIPKELSEILLTQKGETINEIIKMVKVELQDGYMKKLIDEETATDISNKLNEMVGA